MQCYQPSSESTVHGVHTTGLSGHCELALKPLYTMTRYGFVLFCQVHAKQQVPQPADLLFPFVYSANEEIPS